VDVSVIILLKNSRKYLEESLKGIFSQKTDLKFEVIAVDSGSTDNTLEIAGKYPVKIFQIPAEEFNHGLTRNYGVSRSQGGYAIFLTPDAVPADAHWMKKLIDDLEGDARIAGAYSRQVPHRNATALTKVRVGRFFTSGKEKRISYINDPEEFRKMSLNERHRFCNFDNVSSCIRRSVWEKIPFPRTDFGEDLEWAIKVLAAGYKIVYESDSLVYHSHEYSIHGWYERNRMNSHSLLFLFDHKPAPGSLRLLSLALFTALRDMASLFRQGCNRSVVCGFFLAPLYAFSGLFGQYCGARDAAKSLSLEKKDGL